MATTLALIFLTASTGSLTAAQQEIVKQADQRLLAPCCYSQAVGEHMSAEAAQMRQEIEDMAASGESEAAIIAHYKAQYGERVLVVPDGGTGRVLFILPLTPVPTSPTGSRTFPPSAADSRSWPGSL